MKLMLVSAAILSPQRHVNGFIAASHISVELTQLALVTICHRGSSDVALDNSRSSDRPVT